MWMVTGVVGRAFSYFLTFTQLGALWNVRYAFCVLLFCFLLSPPVPPSPYRHCPRPPPLPKENGVAASRSARQFWSWVCGFAVACTIMVARQLWAGAVLQMTIGMLSCAFLVARSGLAIRRPSTGESEQHLEHLPDPMRALRLRGGGDKALAAPAMRRMGVGARVTPAERGIEPAEPAVSLRARPRP